GEVNTRLGLNGIPALAEELIVARDLYLAEYSDIKVHFSHITTAGSVDLIRKAKAKGLKVSASVPAHHLLITDDSAETFDSNFKTNPPFRDQAHIDALISGLKDGTIDAIISDHEPHEIEAKYSEFSRAESGVLGLETAFSVAYEVLKNHIGLGEIIAKFTEGPRAVLNVDHPTIEEGETAELTIFSPSIDWQYNEEEIKSRSKNSPVIGRKLQGLPVAVINNGKLFLNA
ncbi:MAG: amidohydrolase family protein, partial [Flavobacteriales bacterium]|nr:amidohydrolase family protein [Flavobacteriales bacterium]